MRKGKERIRGGKGEGRKEGRALKKGIRGLGGRWEGGGGGGGGERRTVEH
jgi:hypothetical protein